MEAFLLFIHVLGGGIALLALPLALIARKVRGIHTVSGLVFVGGMSAAVISALPLAWLVQSPFLAGVSLFTAYMIASGWRWLRRPGIATGKRWGRGLAAAMFVAAATMVMVGLQQFLAGDTLGIVLLVFAAIGTSLAAEDLVVLNGQRTAGKARRTQLHLGRMIGAGIATVTAVLVVNVSLEPQWIVWLAPTVVGTPMIAIWTARYAKQNAGPPAASGTP